MNQTVAGSDGEVHGVQPMLGSVSAASLILVVEDSTSMRQSLVHILSLAGFQVDSAAHGVEALQCMARRKPDLVLSDVMMPVMDGHALLVAMRSDSVLMQIPVILLSSLADHASLRHAMNLGSDDYLTKPCLPDDLLLAIRTRLARSAQQRAESARLAVETQRLRHVDALTELPNRDALL
ncbi:MAG: response regulator transcription factor, partial [Pseudomonadota bacterium]